MPKISALTSLAQASVDTAADVLPIVDATAPATTKKVTVQAMVNAGLAAAAPQGGIFALTGALTVTGSVGIGAAAPAFIKAYVAGTLPSSLAASRAVEVAATIPSTSTAQGFGYNTNLSTEAAAFTLTTLSHYRAAQGSIGAGSAVTNQFGFVADSTLTGGTLNFGFYSAIASGANRWNFYAAGTAPNYFQGATTFADTVSVSGQSSFAAGSAAAPSVKVGAEQNGLYSSAANTLDVTLNGVRQFQFGYTASAVNYFSVTGSTAGGFSNILESVGSDSNIQNLYASKGTSGHVFRTGGSAGFTQFLIGHAASAVNYWQVAGAAAGGLTTLTTQGSDTNISAYLATKGSGAWRFATGGGDQFRVQHVASAVNFWSAYGGPTSFGPVLYADGTDASLNANYSLKGSGSHVFYTGSTSAVQLVIAHVASSVNWPVISGSATGNAVTISTNGTDTNRSISLTAAGTGLVQITNDSLRIVTSKTPASASATGTQGQISWDADYIYVCTATDTWKRAALATW